MFNYIVYIYITSTCTAPAWEMNHRGSGCRRRCRVSGSRWNCNAPMCAPLQPSYKHNVYAHTHKHTHTANAIHSLFVTYSVSRVHAHTLVHAYSRACCKIPSSLLELREISNEWVPQDKSGHVIESLCVHEIVLRRVAEYRRCRGDKHITDKKCTHGRSAHMK